MSRSVFRRGSAPSNNAAEQKRLSSQAANLGDDPLNQLTSPKGKRKSGAPAADDSPSANIFAAEHQFGGGSGVKAAAKMSAADRIRQFDTEHQIEDSAPAGSSLPPALLAVKQFRKSTTAPKGDDDQAITPTQISSAHGAGSDDEGESLQLSSAPISPNPDLLTNSGPTTIIPNPARAVTRHESIKEEDLILDAVEKTLAPTLSAKRNLGRKQSLYSFGVTRGASETQSVPNLVRAISSSASTVPSGDQTVDNSAARSTLMVALMELSHAKGDMNTFASNMGSDRMRSRPGSRKSRGGSNKPNGNDTDVQTLYENGIEFKFRVSDGLKRLNAISLDALIDFLTSSKVDYQVLEVFLLTFRHVLTPLDLLQRLSKRFDFKVVGELDDVAGQAGSVQLRVANMLTKWITSSYSDFTADPEEELLNVFSELRAKMMLKGFDKLIVKLDEVLATGRTEHADLLAQTKGFKPEKSEFLLDASQQDLVVFELETAKVWSEQLTLIDTRLLKRIKQQEFIMFLWGADQQWYQQLNVIKAIEWFNSLSRWACALVLVAAQPEPGEFQEPPKMQKKMLSKRMERAALVIEKLIEIAKLCRKNHNYFAVMSIVTGLNHGGVSRIKIAWDCVKSKWIKQLRELEQLVDPASSFQNYRDELRNLQGVLPTLPLFSLYLQDLTFINEMSLYRPDGLINFTKLYQIHYKITSFQHFQRSNYDYPENKERAVFLSKISVPSNDELYELSYSCVARGRLGQSGSVVSLGMESTASSGSLNGME